MKCTPSMLVPKEECVYTSCYCEENIWKLCDMIRVRYPDKLSQCFAVFISNDQRKVPIWYQKSAPHSYMPVIWDYHVIMIHKQGQVADVYDFDTTLSFPNKFEDYMEYAIRSNENISLSQHRLFRVVPAIEYLNTFASDRSHMLKDGKFTSPEPQYPIIRTARCNNNLQQFISMDETIERGDVLDIFTFFSFFTSSRTSLLKPSSQLGARVSP